MLSPLPDICGQLIVPSEPSLRAVSNTCSSNYSVYDVSVDAHLSHAHFSANSALCVHFAHLHACAHTRMAQGVHKKSCLNVCLCSLSRLLSCLMIYPSSLLFLEGHFETNLDYDVTDSDIHGILPYFPVLKAQHTRNSAPASRSLVPCQVRCKDKSARALYKYCDEH